jgi:hypothetical protein
MWMRNLSCPAARQRQEVVAEGTPAVRPSAAPPSTNDKRTEKRIPTRKLFGCRKFYRIKTSVGIGFVKGKRLQATSPSAIYAAPSFIPPSPSAFPQDLQP